MLLSYESLTASGTESLSWKCILPGGKLERLEYYLRWPLKLCMFIEWTELEVPTGSVWTKARKSSGIFCPEGLPAAGYACALWWASGGSPSPGAQVFPSVNTKPSLPRKRFTLLVILIAFYKYDKIKRLKKKKKEKMGCSNFFFKKSKNKIFSAFVIHFSRRKTMSVKRENFIYCVNKKNFSWIC